MPAFMEGRDRIEDFFSLYNKRAVDICACAQVINDNHSNCPLLVQTLVKVSEKDIFVVSFFSHRLIQMHSARSNFVFYFCHLLFILTLFSHINKKKKKKNFLVHILDQTKRTYMDRVSFLYIWTNRQIYALRPCIYLATTRRGKKIDERGREGEKEREEKKQE
jgi:hypothetical protein